VHLGGGAVVVLAPQCLRTMALLRHEMPVPRNTGRFYLITVKSPRSQSTLQNTNGHRAIVACRQPRGQRAVKFKAPHCAEGAGLTWTDRVLHPSFGLAVSQVMPHRGSAAQYPVINVEQYGLPGTRYNTSVSAPDKQLRGPAGLWRKPNLRLAATAQPQQIPSISTASDASRHQRLLRQQAGRGRHPALSEACDVSLLNVAVGRKGNVNIGVGGLAPLRPSPPSQYDDRSWP
jgi:hypothetical protein